MPYKDPIKNKEYQKSYREAHKKTTKNYDDDIEEIKMSLKNKKALKESVGRLKEFYDLYFGESKNGYALKEEI